MSEYKSEINIDLIRDFNPPDELNPKRHPWLRYFAFSLDSVLYMLIFYLFIAVILRIQVLNYGFQYYSFLVGSVLYVIFDALLISTLGNTLGRWILGFRLREEDGSKLSFNSALVRSFLLIKHGVGFRIPFYTQFCLFMSYRNKDDSDADIWNEGYDYKMVDLKGKRIFNLVLANILVYMLLIVSVMLSSNVRYKGELNLSQYADNVNWVYGEFFTNNKSSVDIYLDENGEWQVDVPPNVIYEDYWVGDINRELIVEDGIVKGLKVSEYYENEELVHSRLGGKVKSEILSLIYSDNSTKFIQAYDKKANKVLEEFLDGENGEWDYGDYHLSKKTTAKGYLKISDDVYELDKKHDGKAFIKIEMSILRD